jgi:hypothetical protein
VADAGQHRQIGDLQPVEMQVWKNRAVVRGVQKFVGVPTGGQRSSFSLAVADDAGDDQMRIVEGRAISVEQGIPRPGATSDRARSAKGASRQAAPRFRSAERLRPGAWVGGEREATQRRKRVRARLLHDGGAMVLDRALADERRPGGVRAAPACRGCCLTIRR